MLIGLASSLMSGSFQFGNNLGVTTATGHGDGGLGLAASCRAWLGFPVIEEQVWPLVFTGSAMLMVLFAKDLYRVVERVMIVKVLIMIGCLLRQPRRRPPDLAEAAEGLIPRGARRAVGLRR